MRSRCTCLRLRPADITASDVENAAIQTSFQQDAAGGFLGGVVNCHEGERVLTGGAFFAPSGGIASPADADNAYLAGSAPFGTSWYAEGFHRFAQYSIDLREVAFCVPQSRLSGSVTRTKTVDASGFAAVQGTAHCPRGTRVISGGAYFHKKGEGPDPDPGGGSRFSASFPKSNGSGWYASGGGAYGNNGRLTIRARCLDSDRVGSIKIQKEKEATVDANAGGYTFCPGNRAALTGGAYWLRPGKSVKKSAEAGVHLQRVSRHVPGRLLRDRAATVGRSQRHAL